MWLQTRMVGVGLLIVSGALGAGCFSQSASIGVGQSGESGGSDQGELNAAGSDIRLAGGEIAAATDFPSSIFIWHQLDIQSAEQCSATVVGPHVLLTAAHCTGGLGAGSDLIFGANRGSLGLDASTLQIRAAAYHFRIKQVLTYPGAHGWDRSLSDGENLDAGNVDVALIVQDASSEILVNGQLVTSNHSVIVNQAVGATGKGKFTKFFPAASVDLRGVEKFDSVTKTGYGCEVAPNLADPHGLDSMLRLKLAHTQARGQDGVDNFTFGTDRGSGDSLCPGDSGSALYRVATDGQAYVVGVNSYGEEILSSRGTFADAHTRLDGDVGAWIAGLKDTDASSAVRTVASSAAGSGNPVRFATYKLDGAFFRACGGSNLPAAAKAHASVNWTDLQGVVSSKLYRVGAGLAFYVSPTDGTPCASVALTAAEVAVLKAGTSVASFTLFDEAAYHNSRPVALNPSLVIGAGASGADKFTLNTNESIGLNYPGYDPLLLIMQSDGNLVLYDLAKFEATHSGPQSAIWASNSGGRGCGLVNNVPDCRAVLRANGNFEVKGHGQTYFQTGTAGTGSYLMVSPLGPYLRVYDAQSVQIYPKT